jgi:hypothetical protein
MALVLASPVAVAAQNPPPTAPPAQTQPPPTRDQARAPEQVKSPVEGELVSVDAEAKKITVQPASGAELMIAYTDSTEISGAQKDAAGLATMKEARVTVHFTEDPKTKARTATRIIVQPKK